MVKISKKALRTKTTRKTIKDFVNKVIQGDCLEVLKNFPRKSVNMVLCDLPYGTTQNKWDSVIPLDKLWEQYERIIKDNGVIALTGQGIFTAKLILSNEKLFKYKIIWIKSKPTNFLNAKIQPLRKHEDICIFYKGNPTYNPQMTMGEAYDKGFRKDQYTGSYGDFKPRHVKSNGQRYPSDVVMYEHDSPFDINNPIETAVYFKTAESEGRVYHPTQKPVELGRYLVRTYTNPGDIVLDNACGSGSFLLSSLLEGRKYIGIEKNENVQLHKVHAIDYIKVCRDRIKGIAANGHVNGKNGHANGKDLNGISKKLNGKEVNGNKNKRSKYSKIQPNLIHSKQ
ncbi:MAG: DNA-methyltransferase [Chryseotalea sp.]|jgi:site-specific DNA-methyltransferase (adenine-specific)|nr:site-specific DNA-methyltransferase [Cytophagales bacterium]